jgi:hypothetical protein
MWNALVRCSKVWIYNFERTIKTLLCGYKRTPCYVECTLCKALTNHSTCCCHTSTCIGCCRYAYYQAADAAPVLPPVSNAAQLDEQWAAMLLARGAGKLATFVDTEALRARGFAWDDDEAADEQ